MNRNSIIIFFITTFLWCVISFPAAGQVENMDTNNSTQEVKNDEWNFIKTNVTGIILKNYSLQYERVLSKKFSVALQYRIMPRTSLPFQKTILKIVGDENPDTKKIIKDFRLSNYAITPEVRFYVGKKGYGRGFYIAPFYRFASFTSNDLNIFYKDENNVENSITLSGKLTGNTGGILFGVQKFFGERIVLDIWIFGPHIGSGKGDFNGTSTRTLTPDEQEIVRQQLEDLDIPLTDKTVEVNANAASLKLDGLWGGIRGGISFGIKF